MPGTGTWPCRRWERHCRWCRRDAGWGDGVPEAGRAEAAGGAEDRRDVVDRARGGGGDGGVVGVGGVVDGGSSVSGRGVAGRWRGVGRGRHGQGGPGDGVYWSEAASERRGRRPGWSRRGGNVEGRRGGAQEHEEDEQVAGHGRHRQPRAPAGVASDGISY
jgi:hypothetical protein